MAHPAEFRRDVVAVERRHEASLFRITKDFGISEGCLHRWIKQAEIDDGLRPGITQARHKRCVSCASGTGSSGRRTRSFDVLRSIWDQGSTQNDLPAGP